MDNLLIDIKLYLTQFLGFTSKINLLLTSKKYNFIKTTIKEIPDGCQNLTDNLLKTLINLTHLNLKFNKIITDDGIKNLTNLTYLNLRNNKNITDTGLKKLTNLTNLDLMTLVLKLSDISHSMRPFRVHLHWEPSCAYSPNSLPNFRPITARTLKYGNSTYKNQLKSWTVEKTRRRILLSPSNPAVLSFVQRFVRMTCSLR